MNKHQSYVHNRIQDLFDRINIVFLIEKHHLIDAVWVKIEILESNTIFIR
jgi:hypothetical protein